MAEFDERKLYLPAGYSSMVAYCMARRGYTEQEALKRIRVGRYARQFPAIFGLLAAGRLNPTAVLLIGPHLNEANAEALLAAGADKSNIEIERLLAVRFPKSDLLPWVTLLSHGSHRGVRADSWWRGVRADTRA